MAAGNLLALIDDIATVLDDVAVISKVAAQKTAGVLGDDLALNAEQVSGVKAERELPVVWAVAKGSFLNKLILVPAALLISAFLPILITILLMLGGAYLCFEGFEKLAHKFLHDPDEKMRNQQEIMQVLMDPKADMLQFEKKKVQGAIRTDFILSAEIVVIMLGSMQEADLGQQIVSLSLLAIGFTVFVYGLVAAIVKLDDVGLYLLRDAQGSSVKPFKRALGRGLLRFAPFLMKSLSVVGTIAMFLVGGGIIVHGIPFIHHLLEPVSHWAEGIEVIGSVLAMILPVLFSLLIGLIVGALVLGVVQTGQKLLFKGQ